MYIDDILIYSPSLEEHIQHVRAVPERFINHQLYTKAEKCEFHRSMIIFLEYIISAEGVVLDDAKMKAVLESPHWGMATVEELQIFMGFAHFNTRFIHNFSSVAALLLKGRRS